MRIGKRIKWLFETAEHIHFADLVLSALGVKTFLIGIVGGVAAMFVAAADGHSVTVVMGAALLAGIGVSLLVAIITFVVKLARLRPAPAEIEPAANAPGQAGPLEIHVGEDGPFFDVPKSTLYSLTRRLKIEVRNVDRSRMVADCKVQIMAIEPYSGYRPPWLLGEGIKLAAGDQTYLPIAQLTEPRDKDKFPCGDDTIALCTAGKTPLLGAENEHRLTVRATGNDVRLTEVVLRLWTDDAGRLRIAKDGDADGDIPLLEAATRAYELTRRERIGSIAEAHDGTHDGLLRWYCYALLIPRDYLGGEPLMQLFGAHPPSRVRERIKIEKHHVVAISPAGAVLRVDGKDEFIDLRVRAADLARAVREMKSWAAEAVA